MFPPRFARPRNQPATPSFLIRLRPQYRLRRLREDFEAAAFRSLFLYFFPSVRRLIVPVTPVSFATEGCNSALSLFAKEEGRGSFRADRPTRAHPRAQAERKEETAAKAGDSPARKESSNDESRLTASLRLSSGQALA